MHIYKLPLWPPSTNTIWRSVIVKRRQKVILSKPARAFYRDCHIFLENDRDPIEGELSVSIDFYAPTSRAYDVDNRIKAVLDALTKCGVWYDDSQVVEIIARKMTNPATQPLVVILVKPYEIEANDSKT